MKEIKRWFGTRQVPEKEWEAKMLTSQHAQSRAYVAVLLLGSLMCLVALIGLMGAEECSVNLEGNFDGLIQVDSNTTFPLSAFEVNNLNGKVNVTFPCHYILVFNNLKQRGK